MEVGSGDREAGWGDSEDPGEPGSAATSARSRAKEVVSGCMLVTRGINVPQNMLTLTY